MNTFLKLPADERRLAFQQVEAQMGLQAVSVEKDLWVCWTLQTLFAMPGIGDHLTFKGGTSLSKAWKFIQRHLRTSTWSWIRMSSVSVAMPPRIGLQVKRNAESAWRN
jgi:hypothetical protein